MKVTEARFTRRFNVGQYEHEEYTVVAQLDGDSTVDALAELKSDVQKAHAGESGGAATSLANGKGKKGKGKKGKSVIEESEEEETGEDDTETEDSETDTESEEESEETEDTETEETEDTEDEESEEESEDEEEETTGKAGKKTGKKVETKPAAKGSKFKKKAETYLREKKAHKDIFSGVLKKVAPNWKKSFESKSHAKKVSQKLQGKDFLDANGKVLASFEAEAKKMMGKFGK